MKLSVAMAYYNGGKYINEQLSSILIQLREEDEVIVSVDAASDGSKELLDTWAGKDSRIRLIKGPGKGVVKNFEYAIAQCTGDIIFLSDQDDIWKKDKVEKVLRAFEKPDIFAVLHNGVLVDQNGKILDSTTLFELRNSRTGLLKNFMRNSYVGCCMAFRKELLEVILPIPQTMYMHDYWIGMAAEFCGSVAIIKKPLIGYRRHSENVTELSHGSFMYMLKKRINIVRCLCILKKRIKYN